MRVLVACECSGRVREAFRKLGHDAWSCDIQPADDDSPYHYQADVFDVINKGWDLMIAHPPCTYLTVTGNSWFYHPDDKHLLFNMGLLYQSIGMHYEAIKVYEKAVKVDPDFLPAWGNMGGSYEQLEDFEKAIECFEKAVNIDPSNVIATSVLERLKKDHGSEK